MFPLSVSLTYFKPITNNYSFIRYLRFKWSIYDVGFSFHRSNILSIQLICFFFANIFPSLLFPLHLSSALIFIRESLTLSQWKPNRQFRQCDIARFIHCQNDLNMLQCNKYTMFVVVGVCCVCCLFALRNGFEIQMWWCWVEEEVEGTSFSHRNG